MSSLDTAAINSEVSFVKEPDVYWVYGLGCVANKTASPYPPHRRHPLSVYGFVKEAYSHRLKRTLIVTHKRGLFIHVLLPRDTASVPSTPP